MQKYHNTPEYQKLMKRIARRYSDGWTLAELSKSVLKLPSSLGTTEIFGNTKTKLIPMISNPRP